MEIRGVNIAASFVNLKSILHISLLLNQFFPNEVKKGVGGVGVSEKAM